MSGIIDTVGSKSGIVGSDVYPQGHIIQSIIDTDSEIINGNVAGNFYMSSNILTLSGVASGSKIFVTICGGYFQKISAGARGSLAISYSENGGAYNNVMVTTNREGDTNPKLASLSWVHTVGTGGDFSIKRGVKTDSAVQVYWDCTSTSYGDKAYWYMAEIK